MTYYYLCCDDHREGQQIERGAETALALWQFAQKHHGCGLRVVNDRDMEPPAYVYGEDAFLEGAKEPCPTKS